MIIVISFIWFETTRLLAFLRWTQMGWSLNVRRACMNLPAYYELNSLWFLFIKYDSRQFAFCRLFACVVFQFYIEFIGNFLLFFHSFVRCSLNASHVVDQFIATTHTHTQNKININLYFACKSWTDLKCRDFVETDRNGIGVWLGTLTAHRRTEQSEFY